MCKLGSESRMLFISLVPLSLKTFLPKYKFFQRDFRVRITRNPKINFTYNAISEVLLSRITRNSSDNTWNTKN